MTYLDEVHERTVITLRGRDHEVRPIQRERTPAWATWRTLRAWAGRIARPPAGRHRHIGVCRCGVCALRQAGARFG